MKTAMNAIVLRSVPATFRELVRMHEPRPIRDEAEFDAAIRIVQKMAGHPLNRDQDDYLNVLTTLIQAYDQAHHALRMAKMSPLEALRFLMEENGLSASDVGRVIGNRALGSKILREERELSKANILSLAERFSVSPSLFLSVEAVYKRAS